MTVRASGRPSEFERSFVFCVYSIFVNGSFESLCGRGWGFDGFRLQLLLPQLWHRLFVNVWFLCKTLHKRALLRL